MKFTPLYDKEFQPIIFDFKARLCHGDIAVKIGVERNDGYIFIKSLALADESKETLNTAIRFIQGILWCAGGYRIYIKGSKALARAVKEAYSAIYKTDAEYMQRIYRRPFEIIYAEQDFPAEKRCSIKLGGHLDGCRIGLDIGGSDRKVSAVIDGETVYSEEVVWHPKTNSDPSYHYQGILTALKTAAGKLPKVDGIGISTAGCIVDNKVALALLFKMVSPEDFDKYIRDIYIRAAREINPSAPLVVANDGDVSALAGSLIMKKNALLGLAFGTSEAAGYVDEEGNINGFLSELAFVPVDNNIAAPPNEFNRDTGVGTSYFSQDAVIRLAGFAGFEFEGDMTPAQKLKYIQEKAGEGNAAALDIFYDIGLYLGYTLPYYAEFYALKNVMLLGRVMSGRGGDIIIATAKNVLAEEFGSDIELFVPDELTRRVGQSIAAASMPFIG
ncbi:MAG: ROK family protein [Christensenellales bacterium]|jgi:predicted NBD/HSP70 family sugar kinase